jgi:UDP-N-acetyl-2-amino-2-deoxyglucuronate dehydrogenase
MSTSYKFALIGCGQIARRHAEQIAKAGRLVAVCDTDQKKADSFAKAYGATPFYDIDSLLSATSEVDVVSVCTPNGLHANHSIQCLSTGKHVLCEKPMAIRSSDAVNMISAAKAAGKKLFVVKQNRYNPPVQAVKAMLEDGELGTIHSFQVNCFWNRPPEYFADNWRGSLQLDGGTLYTQFSHFIDLLYWFLGDLQSAAGIRQNFLHRDIIDFEDTGVAWLRMKTGAIGSLHYSINACEKNMEGSLTLFGDRRTVKIGGQYLNELEYLAGPGKIMAMIDKGNPPNEYGFYTGSMSNHDRVYQHLLHALSDPSFAFIDPSETLKTIEIIEQIYQSSPLLTGP